MKEKILVIVESPAKSNTISKYLGSDYIVSSSMGHVRDLNPHILSVDVENNYKPHYEELKDKRNIINELKKLSKKSKEILLASDPDREGEAIAFHLRELLKSINSNIYRISFNEVTKKSISEAIEKPGNIDMNKVNSQQMRRLLDRLAGYKISPVLQKKIGGPLSAGRVQSVALKLIVERERAIKSFEPEEYWLISAELKGSNDASFIAKLEKHNGKKLKITTGEKTNEILNNLKQNEFILNKINKKLKKRRAFAPLITSTLQQEAFKRFRFPVKKTMKIAQQLYEGINLKNAERTGLITYMRTDSYRISTEARRAVQQLIISNYGKEYWPEKPNFFKTKKKIQDAHEAIRPTLPFYSPEELKTFLKNDQYKIYKLIWDRFLASQMKEAKIEETTFEINNGNYLFIIKGEIIKFPGYLKILNLQNKLEELPRLNEGEILKLIEIVHKQNFTNPPARYTEAGLVKILEEKGIGRPSTYAKIVDTLGKRDYIYKEDGRFVPTLLGVNVNGYLEENFKDIINYNFTSELEMQLDLVSEGKLEWTKGIDSFYKKLKNDLEKIEKSGKINLLIGRKCPKCNKELARKYSYKTKSWFIGCSAFPECKYTERIDANNSKIVDQILEEKCPKCGNFLVKRYSRKTRSYFIGCKGYPECDYVKSLKEDLGKCPKCGKPLIKRFSRKTKRYFIACSGYPECKYIYRKKK
mgnify:CR=1 FL=1